MSQPTDSRRATARRQPDDLARSAGTAPPCPDRDRPLWRRPAAGRRRLAARRARGPHPVVLMVHGGCWQTEIADRTIMNWIADDLQAARHRRLEHRLSRRRPARRRLSRHLPGRRRGRRCAARPCRRISSRPQPAGRHRPQRRRPSRALARRAAGACPQDRRCAPAESARRSAEVISLGGLPDLEEAARSENGCGNEVVAQLDRPAIIADTSVPRLAPLGLPPGADQRAAGPDHPGRLCRRLCPADARRRRRRPRADDRPHRPCRADRARHRGLGGGGGGDRAGAPGPAR